MRRNTATGRGIARFDILALRAEHDIRHTKAGEGCKWGQIHEKRPLKGNGGPNIDEPTRHPMRIGPNNKAQHRYGPWHGLLSYLGPLCDSEGLKLEGL